MLKPNTNCWRIEHATKASVLIDAEDYFKIARHAMLHAKRRIMLVGWDFDARITLSTDHPDDGPGNLGEFITWLADRNPDLEIYILRWDVGALKSMFRPSMARTVLTWFWRKGIRNKLDSAHPTASSHHQKVVVIDDAFAFCGGIDMTSDRWDTRTHRDDDPGRRQPDGKPYKPWHDATTAMAGPVATALAELCRTRWHRAGGRTIAPLTPVYDYWPDALPAQFTDVDIAIARSVPPMPDWNAVLEIERLYLDQIASAKRLIYAESQYFASRRIAEAIGQRLDEPDGPEIVLINPQTSQGWLEPVAMDSARARLFAHLKQRDKHDRFRIYHPFTAKGAPIYVHAKMLFIDDTAIRVGSSNMNNRSMRLDTECDMVIDITQPANADCTPTITALRNSLIAEHLGAEPDDVAAAIAASGSIIDTIERMRGESAQAGRKTLRPYQIPNLSEVESWLADNEVLDPEGPSEEFEVMGRPTLFRTGWLHKRK